MEIVQLHSKRFKKFISNGQLQNSIAEIVAKINQDYADKTPVFVGVLNGSFLFSADIIKEFNGNCEVAFIRLASYKGTASTGDVNQLMGLSIDLKGRDVIVLEDIVDTGNTLEVIMNTIN